MFNNVSRSSKIGLCVGTEVADHNGGWKTNNSNQRRPFLNDPNWRHPLCIGIYSEPHSIYIYIYISKNVYIYIYYCILFRAGSTGPGRRYLLGVGAPPP